MNETEAVKRQYADDANLALRSRFHKQYSTNKQGLIPWMREQYRFQTQESVLELGCGNGAQWEGVSLPSGCTLVLSDFSPGMLQTAQQRLPEDIAEFRVIDIQNISFTDGAFDAVIANFMLYHVPDMDKALAEVQRVLKPGGRFFAATNGSGGLHAFIRGALRHCGMEPAAFAQSHSFRLQNGGDILCRYFSRVERADYIDSLAVTNTQDLIGWVKSTIPGSGIADWTRLYDHFETIRAADGVIAIPKECGMFIAQK